MEYITTNCKIGERIFEITSDTAYSNHIGQEFERETVDLIRTLTQKHYNVLDVGANIGCTALAFASQADSVQAFEPAPSTFQLLKINIEASGLNNIEAFELGLGEVEESSTITFAPDNRSGGFVSDQTQASKGHIVEKIEIVKGDSLSLKPDLIKLDVEGFEKHSLEGLKKTIKKSKPVVMLEINHWCLNAFQRTSIPDFFDYLIATFPLCYAVDGNNYLDLNDPRERYLVMYFHILQNKFMTAVCAFDDAQLGDFYKAYKHEWN